MSPLSSVATFSPMTTSMPSCTSLAGNLGVRAVGGDDPHVDGPDVIAVLHPDAAAIVVFLLRGGLRCGRARASAGLGRRSPGRAGALRLPIRRQGRRSASRRRPCFRAPSRPPEADRTEFRNSGSDLRRPRLPPQRRVGHQQHVPVLLDLELHVRRHVGQELFRWSCHGLDHHRVGDDVLRHRGVQAGSGPPCRESLVGIGVDGEVDRLARSGCGRCPPR